MPIRFYSKKRRPRNKLFTLLQALVLLGLMLGGYVSWPEKNTHESKSMRVVDGDTLVLDDKRIRLFGIDAPEMKQSCSRETGKYLCGQAAKEALTDFIGAQPVTCEERDIDKYGRMVAICYVGSTEINKWLVAQGHAVAYKNYTDRYNDAEEEARAAKRGIWAGGFQQPSEYRRSKKN